MPKSRAFLDTPKVLAFLNRIGKWSRGRVGLPLTVSLFLLTPSPLISPPLNSLSNPFKSMAFVFGFGQGWTHVTPASVTGHRVSLLLTLCM